MKLFAVYIGGSLPGANIELHDMRFVTAMSILDTYDELRRQWWGKPGSLHIDCWAEIDHADGYDVRLSSEPFNGPEKLYYLNMGGYDPAEFSEKHRNMFVVATSIVEAKNRALKSIVDWNAPHRDNLYEVEQAFSLHESVEEYRLHLHLAKTERPRSLNFTCAYMPIRAPAPIGYVRVT